MKKSLILSIVMTLVLVISMSTATFAWYTSSSEATASMGTITAAAADSNLLISKSANSGFAPSIVYDDVNNVAPLAPIAAFSSVDTFGAADNWTGGTTAIGDGGVETHTITAGKTVTSYTFYISNDAAEAIDVNVEVSDAGAADYEKFIVATGSQVLAYNGAYSLSEVADTTYAEAAADATHTANPTITDVGTTPIAITVYIWFDGWDHVNTNAGETIDLTITFTKAA